MNQSGKRGKARGPTNRGRRTTGSPNHPNFFQSLGDDSEQGSAFENTYFVHAVTSLLGCRVQLTTPGGAVYDGILKAISPKVEVALDIAHKVTKKTVHGKADEDIQVPSRNDTINTLVFAAKNIESIFALNVDRDQVIRKDSFTDQAISNKVNGQVVHERELKKWEDPSGGGDISYILEDNNLHNGLDADEMLAINEQKFGVKSSFDSEMLSYTTPLEKSSNKDFKERERRAEVLAREIEQEGSYAERAELDSGKTEEELYSSVLRGNNSTSTTPRYVPPGRRNKQMQAAMANREEAKPEQTPDKPPSGRDQAVISQPKPQRLQQRRDNTPAADSTSRVEPPVKPAVNNQEVEETPEALPRRDTTPDRKTQDKESKPSNTSPLSAAPARKNVSVSPVSGKPAPQVAGTAAQAGITIARIIPANSISSGTNPAVKSGMDLKQSERKVSLDKPDPKIIDDLKSFKSNFKLADSSQILSRGTQEEKKKVELSRPAVTEIQKPEASRTTPSPQSSARQGSPKSTVVTTTTSTTTSSTPATTTAEEPKGGPTTKTSGFLKASTLNPNAKEFNPLAKEFRPSQPTVQRTPPLATTPQPYSQHVPVPLAIPIPYSPNSGRPVGFGSFQVNPQTQTQMYKQPRSPVHKPIRFFSREMAGDPTHASPTVISAAMATGNPIIAPSMPQQYIAMAPQNVAYPGGMVQQMVQQPGGGMHNVYVLPAGSQPVQPRFVQPQSAGMTTASAQYSVSQAYQDGAMSGPVYVAATPPHQSPAQASPSHQGQFFPYQVPQMMQQQQPGMPPQAQGHMGAPSPSQMGPHHPQQFVYLQPQGAQQAGGQYAEMPGPQMGQFMTPGRSGYSAPRKPQPNWSHSQHPSVQSYQGN